jgi:hypothetical protein
MNTDYHLFSAKTTFKDTKNLILVDFFLKCQLNYTRRYEVEEH